MEKPSITELPSMQCSYGEIILNNKLENYELHLFSSLVIFVMIVNK